MSRQLEPDDHAAECEHAVLAPEVKQSLKNIKIVIIVLLFVAGLFVFFPFSQLKKKNKNANGVV